MKSQIATIKLFKSVLVESRKKKNPSKELMNATLRRGFIFTPEVIGNYSESKLLELTEEIGLTPEQLNSSFHKSWSKIKNASMEQLIIEQLVHYFTTYGYEALGLKADCYIPKEQLDIPEINDMKLTVIQGLSKDELKTKLLNLLSGIAIGEDTIKDVLEVIKLIGLSEKEISKIGNKEVKCTLYGSLEVIPKNPTEFLRYLIYVCTKKTLLIKNKETIETIKENTNMYVVRLFKMYKKQYGLEKLASIFYRYKPLWIAFKSRKSLRPIINKIRKLAVKHHVPMKEDFLNSITSKLKNKIPISRKEIESELSKVNTFRKIRLAYALKYFTTQPYSIMYKVRNGKAWSTKIKVKPTQIERAKKVLEMVMDSIVHDVSKQVKGKRIIIPEHMTYSLPTTEKQFTGYFPSGSYISVPKDMIFGIHWKDTSRRIDLDLSLLSKNSKFGWDGEYRDKEMNILFSGDMAHAPNGASELFYVRKQKKSAFLLMVNYFNFDKNVPAPFQIIVGKEKVKNMKMNYMIDPNKVLSIAESKMDKRQKVLGLLVTTLKECRFYFSETYIGKSISSSNSEFAEDTRDYLFNYYQNTISLREILKKAGAVLFTTPTTSALYDIIDLSPEKLEKDTIINLIGGRK